MVRFFSCYTFIGIFFTFIVGSLLHFAYQFSKRNPVVAFFAPVNESIWEHLKLLFFPAMLYNLLEFFLLHNTYPKLFYSNSIGILLGLWLIPALFYRYTRKTGKSILWVDIFIFFLTTVFTFFIGVILYPLILLSLPAKIMILILDLLMTITFFYCTYHPPNLEIFRTLK